MQLVFQNNTKYFAFVTIPQVLHRFLIFASSLSLRNSTDNPLFNKKKYFD